MLQVQTYPRRPGQRICAGSDRRKGGGEEEMCPPLCQHTAKLTYKSRHSDLVRLDSQH